MPTRMKSGFPQIVTPITTIEVNGVDQFEASKHFCETKVVDDVKIDWLEQSFKENFCGKVEKSIAPAKLTVCEVPMGHHDYAFLNWSEGTSTTVESKLRSAAGQIESKLYHLWCLLSAPGNRDGDEPLLANRYAGRVNVIYIRDVHDKLWTITVDWNANGWSIRACYRAFRSTRGPGKTYYISCFEQEG